MIWAGFARSLRIGDELGVHPLPPSPDWPHQAVFEHAFGSTPRIVAASLAGSGRRVRELLHAGQAEAEDRGPALWMRTSVRRSLGQGPDTVVFYPLAFWGAWAPQLVAAVMVANFFVKVGGEVVMTPVTYRIVGALKRVEHEDYYDRDTNFTPFTLKT